MIFASKMQFAPEGAVTESMITITTTMSNTTPTVIAINLATSNLLCSFVVTPNGYYMARAV